MAFQEFKEWKWIKFDVGSDDYSCKIGSDDERMNMLFAAKDRGKVDSDDQRIHMIFCSHG